MKKLSLHCIDPANPQLSLCGRQLNVMLVDGSHLMALSSYNFETESWKEPENTCIKCAEVWSSGNG